MAADIVREGVAIAGMANTAKPNPKRAAPMTNRRRWEECKSARKGLHRFRTAVLLGRKRVMAARW